VKKPDEENRKIKQCMILLKLKVKQSREFSVIGFPNFQINVEFCPIRKRRRLQIFKIIEVPFDLLGNSFCEMAIATLLTRYRTLYTAGNN
jgi:hypothetical protein